MGLVKTKVFAETTITTLPVDLFSDGVGVCFGPVLGNKRSSKSSLVPFMNHETVSAFVVPLKTLILIVDAVVFAGTRTRAEIMNIVDQNVLQDVIVTIEVHVSIVLLENRLHVLDQRRGVAVFTRGARMDRKVSQNNVPIGSRTVESVCDELELLVVGGDLKGILLIIGRKMLKELNSGAFGDDSSLMLHQDICDVSQRGAAGHWVKRHKCVSTVDAPSVDADHTNGRPVVGCHVLAEVQIREGPTR